MIQYISGLQYNNVVRHGRDTILPTLTPGAHRCLQAVGRTKRVVLLHSLSTGRKRLIPLNNKEGLGTYLTYLVYISATVQPKNNGIPKLLGGVSVSVE